MLGVLCLFAQVVTTPFRAATEERPVRLWLGASPIETGAALPVYVAAANDGYLLVLRVATDGRVSVVFPADPTADGRVTRGSYELRHSDGRPALIVNEGRGTGLVLAALSETPFRFGEFTRSGRWDGGLLAASYPGADGPGTLTDIAQRMLGDGWFNSAFALYTVRPAQSEAQRAQARAEAERAEAQRASDLQERRGQNGEIPAASDIATCNGCTVVYETVLPTPAVEQTVIERTYVESYPVYASPCDVWAGSCYSRGFSSDRRGWNWRGFKTQGICSIGIDCPPTVVSPPAKAITMHRASLRMSPVARPQRPAPQVPQTPPGEYTRRVPAQPATGSQRMIVMSKPTRVTPAGRGEAARGEAVRRVGRVTTSVAAAPKAAPVAAPRTGRAMTARQSGTALRAAKLLPPRR